MTIQHVDISDPFLHEPKGVSGASADTVYVADGSGSGDWQLLSFDSLDSTSLFEGVQDALDDGTLELPPAELTLTGVIANISAAETVYVPVPVACTVRSVTFVLEGTLTDADATITVRDNTAGSMGTQVVPFDGSTAGDTFHFEPVANDEIAAESFLTVETDGASTGAQRLWFTVHATADRWEESV